MPYIVLGIYLAFFVTAFGLRSFIQYRRTGDFGFRVLSGGERSISHFGRALLLLALVLAGAAPAAALLGLTRAFYALDIYGRHAIGLSLMLLGCAVTIVSQFQMGDSWRVGVDESEKTMLVTAGLFGIVRNPIFTGMLLATAGLFVSVPNSLSAIALLSLLIGLEIQVRMVEEPYLVSIHGGQYVSYARKVGRFLPWIGRL